MLWPRPANLSPALVTRPAAEHPGSSHVFNDQTERYASGKLRDVYFYRPRLEGHIKRQYKPGE